MTPKERSPYDGSIKSDISDEWVNTHILRPAAGMLVRLLYPTSVTPNQVTLAATASGCLAAFLYSYGLPAQTAAAGLCLTLKDLLDSADGQLARARQQYSRSGRFLDSIGDFLVNFLVFISIGASLFGSTGDSWILLLAAGGFWGITFRVSYHVFYQTSYLHLLGRYAINRVTEEIRTEDLRGDREALRLQRVFQLLYGWQDRWMVRLDRWCRKGLSAEHDAGWYSNRTALRISGFLGLGTELSVLMLFSLVNRLEEYLYFNVLVMNGAFLASVMYRKILLAQRIRRGTEGQSRPRGQGEPG